MKNWDTAADSWLESINSLVPRLPKPGRDQQVVAPGQVWRARWDNVVSMVLVDHTVGTFRNLVRVAPITVGADLADDRTVILPPDSSMLSVSLSVWSELTTDIAEVVLERWITDLNHYTSLEALHSAADDGLLERGLPILNNDGPRAQERHELALAMQMLAGAVKLISGSGSLPDMISAAGLGLRALSEALKMNVSQTFKVADGTSGVDVVQARSLAILLQVNTDTILGANPAVDDGLIEALTRLTVRPRLIQLEQLDRTSDSLALDEVTRGALALAARQEGDVTAWKARVDLYFEVKLGDKL